jgi:Fe-S oxidoreductase
MARLKAEFLHHHFRARGLPWRNRLFGRVADLARWGCRLWPVSNWLARSAPVRWLNDKLLGIDRRRLPPAFARRTLVGARASRPLFSPYEPDARAAKSGILLFPDTFTNYYEPDVGLAAAELFRRAGRTVTLGPADLKCCGRPLISNGLLDEAVGHAAHNVARLYPWAAASGPIVTCEPSCVLTINDDYPALLRGEARRQAEAVAAACRTFPEALEALLAEASLGPALSFRPGPGRVLVQPHCHERSLVGSGPLLRLLRRVPGAEVIDLDAGCCGLAGSFGYEREHYEVSRLVGEQRLFPALRQAPAGAAVVASGFSCRLQIAHCAGQTALHPARLLRTLQGE